MGYSSYRTEFTPRGTGTGVLAYIKDSQLRLDCSANHLYQWDCVQGEAGGPYAFRDLI